MVGASSPWHVIDSTAATACHAASHLSGDVCPALCGGRLKKGQHAPGAVACCRMLSLHSTRKFTAMESSHLNTVPKYSSMYASPGSCSLSKGSLVLQAKSSLFFCCSTLQSCIPSPLLTPSLQSVLSFWPVVGTSKELLKKYQQCLLQSSSL